VRTLYANYIQYMTSLVRLGRLVKVMACYDRLAPVRSGNAKLRLVKPGEARLYKVRQAN
jgi:hypothetical protein